MFTRVFFQQVKDLNPDRSKLPDDTKAAQTPYLKIAADPNPGLFLPLNSDPEQVLFRISDSGPPIILSQLAQIFLRLFVYQFFPPFCGPGPIKSLSGNRDKRPGSATSSKSRPYPGPWPFLLGRNVLINPDNKDLNEFQHGKKSILYLRGVTKRCRLS